MILAIETATHVCSVALGHSFEDAAEMRTEEHGSHSEKLFEFIQSLVQQKNSSLEHIDAVVVSAGPGSYTGLRIAASGLKGLLFRNENDTALYKADTLASFGISTRLANDDHRIKPNTVHAVIDARRKHLYYRSFKVKANNPQYLLSDQAVDVVELDKINSLIQPGDLLVGTGISRLDSAMTSMESIHTFGDEVISARGLIALYNRAFDKRRKEHMGQDYLKLTKPELFTPRYVR